MHLTFVLLPRGVSPHPDEVSAAYSSLFGDSVVVESGDVLTVRTRAGVETLATLVDAPIATGEVEAAAMHSIAALSGAPIPTAHQAHLIVATPGDSSPDARLNHSRIVAALACASGARAVYDGAATATHPTEFLLDVLAEEGLPVAAWVGVSAVEESRQCFSLLSHGMPAFGLPDVLVISRPNQAEDALNFLLCVAEYCIARGSPPTPGETIGRSPSEKPVAERVPSPVDPESVVLRIDLSTRHAG
jgi:hypothetical protein